VSNTPNKYLRTPEDAAKPIHGRRSIWNFEAIKADFFEWRLNGKCQSLAEFCKIHDIDYASLRAKARRAYWHKDIDRELARRAVFEEAPRTAPARTTGTTGELSPGDFLKDAGREALEDLAHLKNDPGLTPNQRATINLTLVKLSNVLDRPDEGPDEAPLAPEEVKEYRALLNIYDGLDDPTIEQVVALTRLEAEAPEAAAGDGEGEDTLAD